MRGTLIKKIFTSIKDRTLFSDVFRHLYITREFFKILNIFLPFIRIDDRKIVFCSYYGSGFSCNPKYIALELLAKDIQKKFKLIWLIDPAKAKEIGQFPPGIILVNYCSFRAFFELASAKIWIDNCRKFLYSHKRKKQFYFQTWHGIIGPKKVERDAEDKLPLYYIKNAKNDSQMIDYCISNGRYMSRIFRESFWYKGEILETGSPRNDILINNFTWKIIKKKLDLPEDCKIILYAPTFRNTNPFDAYTIDYIRTIKTIEGLYDGKWFFLSRLHPNLLLNSSKMQIPDWVINVTTYPDVQELLGITDILITDYSSIMFDFMFTKRPVFIYAADYEKYKKERDVYISLFETPFLVAENNEQLINNISSFTTEKYKSDIDEFISHVGCFEYGNASKSVVKKIEEIIHRERL
jgi:CDP-glycerol glycerophosphotransferase